MVITYSNDLKIEYEERKIIVKAEKMSDKIIIEPVTPRSALYKVYWAKNGKTVADFEGTWSDTNLVIDKLKKHISKIAPSANKVVKDRWEMNHGKTDTTEQGN